MPFYTEWTFHVLVGVCRLKGFDGFHRVFELRNLSV
jgi:hypothetical protein